MGKTRFAIRLAQSVGRLYPDGTWFVDVSGVGGAGSVADEVGTVLGLQAAPADDFGPVARYFGGKQGLLELDSCEQVVDQCAQLVTRILGETNHEISGLWCEGFGGYAGDRVVDDAIHVVGGEAVLSVVSPQMRTSYPSLDIMCIISATLWVEEEARWSTDRSMLRMRPLPGGRC